MLVPLLTLLAVSHAPSPARPIKITDYRSLVSIDSPQISPDGKRIVLVRSVADFQADKRITSLLIVDAATGKTAQVTDGKKAVSSPRWSPVGDQIAYLAEGANKSDQVFILPVRGGGARAITRTTNGVQQFAWSPDGRRIAFVTRDDDPAAARIKRNDDLFDVGENGFLIKSAAMPSHLWVVSAAGEKGSAPRRLTHGKWSVLETAGPIQGGTSDPSWSADGRWITFARQANADNSRSDLSTVATVNVATGEVRSPTGGKSYEYQPVFSSIGSAIAYVRPHGPTPLSVMDVCMTRPAGGETILSAALDRDVTDLAWTQDGRSLILGANEGLQKRLWIMRPGGTPRALDLGELTVGSIAAGKGGSIAFTAVTATTPPELYFLSGPSAKPRRLTDFNAPLRRFRFGRTERVQWSAPDGEKSDGVLTYPVDYVAGRKYPLLVWLHGGPEGAAPAAFIGFEGDLLRQPMAGAGYVVFYPNYRGSNNLGNAHEHAIFRDPGEGPAADVISGIDMLVKRGLINEKRISVAGHSYGGYLTAWLIGHDHRWKCAIAAASVTDWRDVYSLSSSGNLAWARDSLGGGPWDPESAELYHTASPITYADRMVTPTLVITGMADEQAPLVGSFTLYHALKDRHIPVRFVGIPGSIHTPQDPVRYERYNAVMMEWVRQHDK